MKEKPSDTLTEAVTCGFGCLVTTSSLIGFYLLGAELARKGLGEVINTSGHPKNLEDLAPVITIVGGIFMSLLATTVALKGAAMVADGVTKVENKIQNRRSRR